MALPKTKVISIRDAVLAHAMSTGHFAGVQAAELINAPTGPGMYVGAWMGTITPVPRRSGLNGVSVRIGMTMRIYSPMLSDPREDIDPTMMNACADLFGLFIGDFTLGDEVAEVDLLGAYGDPLSAEDGHIQIDRKIFRIYEIKVPLILNDLWTQAP